MSWLVAFVEAASLRLQLNTFPKLFTGSSVSDGILVVPSEKQNLPVIFPFFNTRDLDLAVLKLMQAQEIIS